MLTSETQADRQARKIVGIQALRKIAKLVVAQKLAEEEKSFLLKRALIACACFVAYPLPAFELFNSAFGRYMSKDYPIHNKLILFSYLLVWCIALIVPLMWPTKNDEKEI